MVELSVERFLDLVKDAYGKHRESHEKHLVSLFIDGLDDGLARTLIDRDPATIDQAIGIAKDKKQKDDIWESRIGRKKLNRFY